MIATRNIETHLLPGASPELHEKSQANIQAITASYLEQAVSKGQFATAEAAQAALAQETERVATQHSVTMNMSAEGLGRFLTAGRAETAWDYAREKGVTNSLGHSALNGKNMAGNYSEVREVTETGLRRYAPVDAARHEPIYGAVAANQELKSGAAPSYGHFWIEMDDSLAERTVYSFSDSMAAAETRDDGTITFDDSAVLSAEDVPTAKAITNLAADYRASKGMQMVGSMARNVDPNDIMVVADRRPGYVEAAIFDEVTLDNVTIGMALVDAADMHGAGRLFQQHGEALAGKTKVYCGDAVQGLITDWLSQQTGIDVVQKGDEPPQKSTLWDRLDLEPTATYSEVATAVKQQLGLVYRDLKLNGRLDLPQLRRFGGDLVWSNYIKNLRSAAKHRGPAIEQKMDELIALQQARVFFEDLREAA